MITWTEDTTYSSATNANTCSGPSTEVACWTYAVVDFIKNDIDDIEDFAYAHEERGYFNFLFRSLFKKRFFLVLQVHLRSIFFYYRLLFSVSGWLNRKAKAKKGKQNG